MGLGALFRLISMHRCIFFCSIPSVPGVENQKVIANISLYFSLNSSWQWRHQLPPAYHKFTNNWQVKKNRVNDFHIARHQPSNWLVISIASIGASERAMWGMSSGGNDRTKNNLKVNQLLWLMSDRSGEEIAFIISEISSVLLKQWTFVRFTPRAVSLSCVREQSDG